MSMIKVGFRYINLDAVYQISFNDKQREGKPDIELVAELDVVCPVSMYPDEDDTGVLEAAGMRVFGQEAEALRYWLDANSDDVMEINRVQEYDRVSA
jgi:hypothetical protein